MSHNIILQHYCGNPSELERSSFESVKSYAYRLGADYELLGGKPFSEAATLPTQKLYLLDQYFDAYDNVCLLDSDMFPIAGLEDSVFDLPGEKIGKYASHDQTMHYVCWSNHVGYAHLDYAYVSGSIYVLSRDLRIRLREHLDNFPWDHGHESNWQHDDEWAFHWLCWQAGVTKNRPSIPYEWSTCSFNLDKTPNAKLIHIRDHHETRPPTGKLEVFRKLRSSGII